MIYNRNIILDTKKINNCPSSSHKCLGFLGEYGFSPIYKNKTCLSCTIKIKNNGIPHQCKEEDKEIGYIKKILRNPVLRVKFVFLK